MKMVLHSIRNTNIMSKFFFTLAVIFFGSCNPQKKIKSIDKDGMPMHTVESDDSEMNNAILQATASLYKFDAALSSKNKLYDYFTLKVRYSTPDGGEHIWVGDIKQEKGDYYGVINNTPESTTEVKLGDTVKVNKNNITDWMYVENNKLRGGYTVRLLRNRMNEAERKQFDSTTFYSIEN